MRAIGCTWPTPRRSSVRKGLKYSDDSTDAAWLAHLLRLGLLPEGHIYPKETRPVRDLLRRRSQLVRCRTAQILAIKTQLARSTGRRFGGNLIKRLDVQELRQLVGVPELALAIASNLEVMRCLYRQIAKIEKAVLARAPAGAGVRGAEDGGRDR